MRARPALRGPRLFGEPEKPEKSGEAHVAYVDGASRGNPGPAAYGVVIYAPDGKKTFQIGKYLGRATNNVAEYYGLITALDYAASHNIRRLRVRSDSELLVRQMHGQYKVKSATLKPMHEHARKLAARFEFFAIEHIRRELNSEADALCNEALDQTGSRAAGPPAKKSSGTPRAGDRKMKARYVNGALQTAVPLELAEGEEVEIIIRRR